MEQTEGNERTLVRIILARDGIEVRCSDFLAEGIEKVRESSPEADLLLVDSLRRFSDALTDFLAGMGRERG